MLLPATVATVSAETLVLPVVSESELLPELPQPAATSTATKAMAASERRVRVIEKTSGREGSGRQTRLNDSSGEPERFVQTVDPLGHLALGSRVNGRVRCRPEGSDLVRAQRERPDRGAPAAIDEVVGA